MEAFAQEVVGGSQLGIDARAALAKAAVWGLIVVGATLVFIGSLFLLYSSG